MKIKTRIFVPSILFFYFAVTIGIPVAKSNTPKQLLQHGPEKLFLYTYHTHPPFLLSHNKGLSYDLARYLTLKSRDRYEFVVKSMSRPRVNKILFEGKGGVIPWVNPVWFKDKKEEKYMWTKGALMEDGNAIISHIDKKIVYNGTESLKGLVLGGLRGHVYQAIDSYIKETGQLIRVDAENHIDNFKKLAKQRIDVTLMPESGVRFYINQEKLQDLLFISPRPHSRFQRRMIIIDKRKELLDFMDRVLLEMQTDVLWKQIMDRYR